MFLSPQYSTVLQLPDEWVQWLWFGNDWVLGKINLFRAVHVRHWSQQREKLMRNGWVSTFVFFCFIFFSKLDESSKCTGPTNQTHPHKATKNLVQVTTWPSIKRKHLKSVKEKSRHTTQRTKVKMKVAFSPGVMSVGWHAEVRSTPCLCAFPNHTTQPKTPGRTSDKPKMKNLPSIQAESFQQS